MSKMQIREVESFVTDELTKLGWGNVTMMINAKAYNEGYGQILRFKAKRKTHTRKIDKIAVFGIDRDKQGNMYKLFWSTGLSTDTFFGTEKCPSSLKSLTNIFLDISDARGEMKGKQLGIV